MTYKDKVKHLICGAIAAIVGAVLLAVCFGSITYLQAFACGCLCAGAAGVAAEVKDMAYHRMAIAFFDVFDLLATIVGGAAGAAIGATVAL